MKLFIIKAFNDPGGGGNIPSNALMQISFGQQIKNKIYDKNKTCRIPFNRILILL